MIKVKGFDKEGRATYVKGITILSVISGDADEEIFVYGDEEVGNEPEKIYYKIEEQEDKIILSTYRNWVKLEEWERLYKENGKIKSDIHRFSTFGAQTSLEYRYNEEGKMLESILYDLDGTAERIDTFEYEENKLKTIIVKLQGYERTYPSIKKEFLYEGDKLKNEKEYIYPDTLIRETLFEYKDDMVIKRKEERYLPSRVSSFFQFTYNNDMKLLKEEYFENDLLVYIKRYDYDDKGRNIIQELTDSSSIVQGFMEFKYKDVDTKKNKLNEFLKERFFLEFLDIGLVEYEKGFTRSKDGDFEYELFYEYDDRGRIKRIHR